MAVRLDFPCPYSAGSYCGRPLREFWRGLGIPGSFEASGASGSMGAIPGVVLGESGP